MSALLSLPDLELNSDTYTFASFKAEFVSNLSVVFFEVALLVTFSCPRHQPAHW